MKEENIQYKRDMNHNYLIIKGSDSKENYQFKMILNNQIEGILDLQKRSIDGEIYYYYEISSKQPMNRFFDKKEIDIKQLKNILWEIKGVMECIGEYLLDGSSLVFNPNYLYFDVETMKISMVFFPDYTKTLKESFCELVEYVLERIDHSEEKAVFMAYQIYKITRKSNFTLDQILFLLEKEEENVELSKQTENFTGIEKQEKNVITDLARDINYPVTAKEEIIEKALHFKKKSQARKNIENVNASSEIDELNIRSLDVKIKRYGIFIAGIIVFLVGIIIVVLELFSFEIGIIISGVGAMVAVAAELRQILLSRKLANQEEMREIEESDYVHMERREPEEIEIRSFFDPIEKSHGNTVLLGTSNVQEERMLRGKIKGKNVEFSLEKLPVTIGKIQELVDITINDNEISRIHARFFEKNNQIYLEDMNSTNGTFKNGIQLEANEIVVVEASDEIFIGKYKFTYN